MAHPVETEATLTDAGSRTAAAELAAAKKESRK